MGSLPEIDSRENLRALALRSCYSDPLLRHPKTYANLMKRLHGCGLVQYYAAPAKATVELFFVNNKAGQLRMVVDCRHSNCFFKDPSGVALTTGDSLSRIEVGEDETLNFASADLKDAFYHLALPKELQHLFGLRPLRAGDVDVIVHIGSWVHPKRNDLLFVYVYTQLYMQVDSSYFSWLYINIFMS